MGGVKALLQLANFSLGPDATLNTEIHKNSVRIKAPNSVNASERKHKNQINHYKSVLLFINTHCKCSSNIDRMGINNRSLVCRNPFICFVTTKFLY